MIRLKTALKPSFALQGIFMLFIIHCSLLITNCIAQSITWQRTYGYEGVINKMQQTIDGGYIATGVIGTVNSWKMILIKLNAYGNTSWVKIVGVGSTTGNWVEQTSDKGYIIGGSIDSGMFADKVYLAKMDSLGNIEWHKSYSNSDLDECYCVKQTPDGGYILACRTTPSFADMTWFIRTDSLGNLILQKVYGNGLNTIYIKEIALTFNGYIAAGGFNIGQPADVYLMKLDLNGDTIWTKRKGGNLLDAANSIDKVNGDGFIVGGISKSFNTNNKTEAYIIKIDTNGQTLWQRTYSNIGVEECYSVRYKPNFGYAFCGFSDSLGNFNQYKAKLRLIDFNGNQLFENSFAPGQDDHSFNSLELTTDGGFILGGYANLVPGDIKPFAVKTDSLGRANPIGINDPVELLPYKYFLYPNFPNPFNSTTIIRYELKENAYVELYIYDILGKLISLIDKGNKFSGLYNIRLDATSYNMASGIYFLSLNVMDKNKNQVTFTKKIIYLK